MDGIPRPKLVETPPVPVLNPAQRKVIMAACAGSSYDKVRDRAIVTVLALHPHQFRHWWTDALLTAGAHVLADGIRQGEARSIIRTHRNTAPAVARKRVSIPVVWMR